MSMQYFGALSALQFDTAPDQVFGRIVEDLDTTFRPYGLGYAAPTWRSNTVVALHRDSLIVLLGWIPAKSDHDPCYLVLAAGHTTQGGNLLVTRQTCELVRGVLEQHLKSTFRFDRVFHADATHPVDTPLLGIVEDILDRENPATLPQSLPDFDERTAFCTPEKTLLRDPGAAGKAAGDAMLPPKADPESVANQNHSILVADEAEASLPKRLTVCALGATMLIQVPPVGAGLLAYTAMKGLTGPREPSDPLAA